MAKIQPGTLHDFVNGEIVTEEILDSNFEIIRVAINDTDSRVDNTYTKAEVDIKINQATATKNVAAGTQFPDPPNTDGQEFFRTDIGNGTLYVYYSAYNNPDPNFGHWKKIGEVTPASTTTLGGVVVGEHFNVDANGKITLKPATLGQIGGVRPSGSRFTIAGDGTLDLIMGVGSNLDADKVHNVEGKYVALAARFFKYLLSGRDGDLTVSSSIEMPKHVMAYNNLTINASRLFYHPAVTDATEKGPIFLGVAGTLTLNGQIVVEGCGAAGGEALETGVGAGGAGGGVIVIVANQIVGNGTITANGQNGPTSTKSTPSTAVAGNAGNAGKLFGLPIPGAPAATGRDSGGNGGTANTVAANLMEAFISGMISIQGDDIGGGGGASAPTDYSYGVDGPGGGAGVGGAGGKGGAINTTTSSNRGAPGGGGGGGGLIVIVSPNPVPAIQVQAKGGNGGTGIGYTGGAGGGGGGAVLIYAPSSSAVVNVAGGTGAAGTSGGAAGANGGAGVSKFIQI